MGVKYSERVFCCGIGRRKVFRPEHRFSRGRPAGNHGRPDWRKELPGEGGTPRGLSVARMAAHITYLSETALHRKFGRRLRRAT